jgi:hypothetical protein
MALLAHEEGPFAGTKATETALAKAFNAWKLARNIPTQRPVARRKRAQLELRGMGA